MRLHPSLDVTLRPCALGACVVWNPTWGPLNTSIRKYIFWCDYGLNRHDLPIEGIKKISKRVDESRIRKRKGGYSLWTLHGRVKLRLQPAIGHTLSAIFCRRRSIASSCAGVRGWMCLPNFFVLFCRPAFNLNSDTFEFRALLLRRGRGPWLALVTTCTGGGLQGPALSSFSKFYRIDNRGMARDMRGEKVLRNLSRSLAERPGPQARAI